MLLAGNDLVLNREELDRRKLDNNYKIMAGSIFRLYLLIHLIEMMVFSGAVQYNHKCFPVHGKSVCFYQFVSDSKPPELVWKTWNYANQMCLSENATLPLIVNGLMQETLQRYINSLQLVSYTSNMWMAGREVNMNRWKWVDGDKFSLTGNRIIGGDNNQNNHVALTDRLELQAQSASESSNYVCQHFGETCQAQGSIRLENGCVLPDTQETVTFYEARNRCLERGGDLVVINNNSSSSSEDLKRLRQVFSTSKGTRKLWIGLRRVWWQWNSNLFNENIDVKYSNWDADHGFKRDLGCMSLNPVTGKWSQSNCTSSYFWFICQTDMKEPNAAMDESQTTRFSFNIVLTLIIAGVAFLVLIIVVVVVIVVVVTIKKRKTTKNNEKSYRHLFNRNLEENGTDSDKDKYTHLQLTQLSRDTLCHPQSPNHEMAPQHSPTLAETQSCHYEYIIDNDLSYLELQSSV